MIILRAITLTCAVLSATTAQAQNAPARPTPQTSTGAPAATSPSATAAQAAEAGAARNSATRGSKAQAAQGRTRSRSGSASQPGITGVPRYRAGFRGPSDSEAPAETGKLTITGVNDGSTPNSTQSSVLPGLAMPHNAYGIAKGTPIHVRLQTPVDSGHARNGEMVKGVLTAPIGGVPAGAPVQLTVVAVAPAGQMTSNGELSLQVVSVNGQEVLSDVITAEGKEGTKLLPDAAPGRGTEAIFTADQAITLPAG